MIHHAHCISSLENNTIENNKLDGNVKRLETRIQLEGRTLCELSLPAEAKSNLQRKPAHHYSGCIGHSTLLIWSHRLETWNISSVTPPINQGNSKEHDRYWHLYLLEMNAKKKTWWMVVWQSKYSPQSKNCKTQSWENYKIWLQFTTASLDCQLDRFRTTMEMNLYLAERYYLD